MNHVTRTGFLCERGREWISLRLDGELSELAQKMLESHLARCADCRAFEEQVSGLAEQLRAAPLEELERPIQIASRRRAPLRVWSLGAAAASVAAAAVGVLGFLNLPSSNSLPSSAPLVIVPQPSGNEDLRFAREMRAAGLKPAARPPRRYRGPQKT